MQRGKPQLDCKMGAACRAACRPVMPRCAASHAWAPAWALLASLCRLAASVPLTRLHSSNAHAVAALQHEHRALLVHQIGLVGHSQLRCDQALTTICRHLTCLSSSASHKAQCLAPCEGQAT